MRLLLAAALAITFAACSDPTLAPGDAYEQAQAATDANDGARAVRLLRHAAAAGHLWARHDLSEALTRGYVSAPWSAERPGARHVPIRTWPGEGALRRHQYETALRRGVARGDTAAALLVALRLRLPSWDGTQWRDPTAAHRDSALALLLPLAEAGHVSALLLLAELDGRRTPAGRAWTRRAIASEGERGCWLAFTVDPAGWRRGQSAPAVLARIDEAERCARYLPSDHPARDYAPDLLRRLNAEARTGNGDAASLRDTLVTLGVFRKHPSLAGA